MHLNLPSPHHWTAGLHLGTSSDKSHLPQTAGQHLGDLITKWWFFYQCTSLKSPHRGILFALQFPSSLSAISRICATDCSASALPFNSGLFTVRESRWLFPNQLSTLLGHAFCCPETQGTIPQLHREAVITFSVVLPFIQQELLSNSKCHVSATKED